MIYQLRVIIDKEHRRIWFSQYRAAIFIQGIFEKEGYHPSLMEYDKKTQYFTPLISSHKDS